MSVAGLHEVASVAVERMVYSLAEGSLLTLVLAVALRLLPAKASQTRFVIWLSALFSIVLVTVFGLHGTSQAHAVHAASLLTLPFSFALGAFALWALLATLGLLRIGLGLWQLRKMRRQCEPVIIEELPESAQELIRSFQSVRRVTLLMASDSSTPKAVGFFVPAIILPAWLLQQPSGDELNHVLLHELAHLRRRDDWTNLLQQVVKALFFFHPAIWWMERELALSREQACDDAALEQTANAHDYARSLALVAEKSFIRRQIALAQAVIGRAHQLTQRLTRILDPRRPTKSQLWKPAIPLVALAATICGFSASWTPALVRIEDASSFQVASLPAASAVTASSQRSLPTVEIKPSSAAVFGVKAWPARMNLDPTTKMKLTKLNLKMKTVQQTAQHRAQHPPSLIAANAGPDHGSITHSSMMMARYSQVPRSLTARSSSAARTPNNGVQALSEDSVSEDLVLFVATQETISAGPNGWRLQVSQVRWVVPAKAFHKPAPNKT